MMKQQQEEEDDTDNTGDPGEGGEDLLLWADLLLTPIDESFGHLCEELNAEDSEDGLGVFDLVIEDEVDEIPGEAKCLGAFEDSEVERDGRDSVTEVSFHPVADSNVVRIVVLQTFLDKLKCQVYLN